MKRAKNKQPWRKSWTIQWGHIQNLAGLAIILLPLFDETNFPGFKPWMYGMALVVSGVITYYLRSVTTKPLGK